MSIKRDAITEYQRRISENIEKHRSQPLGDSRLRQTQGNIALQSFGGLLPKVENLPGGGSLTFGSDWESLKQQGIHTGANLLLGAIYRRSHMEVVSDRMDQVLETRGYLEVEYPDGGTMNIPFFENPKITESRKSTYARSPVLNRNEPWRLWTGADAKTLNISFNFTLPHLQHFWKSVMSAVIFGAFQELPDKRIKVLLKYLEDIKGEYGDANGHLEGVFGDVIGGESTHDPGTYDGGPSFDLGIFKELEEGTTQNHYLTAVRSLAGKASRDDTTPAAWVLLLFDFIRSLVLGGSTSPNSEGSFITGPPIVRLYFGALYHGEKFITTSYKFAFDDKAGYDNLTLLPRVSKLQLQLQSFNQGDSSPETYHSVLGPGQSSMETLLKEWNVLPGFLTSPNPHWGAH